MKNFTLLFTLILLLAINGTIKAEVGKNDSEVVLVEPDPKEAPKKSGSVVIVMDAQMGDDASEEALDSGSVVIVMDAQTTDDAKAKKKEAQASDTKEESDQKSVKKPKVEVKP